MSLNLEFLRWKSKVKNFSQDQMVRFSRRQFLRGSAAMALVHDFPAALGGPIILKHEGQSASLLIGGVERWAFAPEMLPGATLRVVANTPQKIEFEISGGHYAGTEVAFDLRLRAVRGLLGWAAQFDLPMQRVSMETDLRQWLAGQPLRWSQPPDTMVRAARSPIALRISGTTVASFDCKWRLGYQGHVEVRLPHRRLHSAAEAQLQPSASVSGMEPLAIHEGPYTRFTVHPHRADWGRDLVPLLDATVIDILPGEPLFDQLHVDLWEPKSGQSRVAASFSHSDDQSITATVRGSLLGSDGAPARLQLQKVAYTIAAQGNRLQSIFLASLARETTAWGDGHAVTLDHEFEVSSGLAAPGKLAASIGVSALSVKHFELADGASIDLILPAGMKLPALRLDERNVFGRAVEEFLARLFTGERFELSLDRVTVRLLRPADMLHLRFAFNGLKLKMHCGRPYLAPENSSARPKSSFITVEFPPQNLEEESFFEDAAGNDSAAGETIHPQVKTMSAQPSRLRFKLPLSLFHDDRLPFTIDTLLGWDKFQFQSGKSSTGKKGTSIEVPYRLHLTPPPNASFVHDIAPRTKVQALSVEQKKADREQAPELWGTLIQTNGQRARQGFDATPIDMTAFGASDVVEIMRIQALSQTTVRAYLAGPFQLATGNATIYAAGKKSASFAGSVTITAVHPPDAKNFPHLYSIEYTLGCTADPPFDLNKPVVAPPSPLWIVQVPATDCSFDRAHGVNGICRPPLQTEDRAQIVVLTSGEVPSPINVNRLELTALGAWFDADTKWDLTHIASSMIDLTSWRHLTVQGRDAYVQTEYLGFLFPFGHEATLVVRTERAFFSVKPVQTCDADKMYCYLRQRFFVKVKEPSKTYPDSRQSSLGRDLPFTRIVINTPITPPLDDPQDHPFAPGVDAPLFCPTVLGQRFQFDLTGYDWAKPANPISFKAPLIFVSKVFNSDPKGIQLAIDAYANKLNCDLNHTPALAVPVAITSWSITGNVATFMASNTLSPWQRVTLSGFTTGSFLDSQTVTVLANDLSRTQFKAAFNHPDAAGTDAGQALGIAGNVVQFNGQHIHFAASKKAGDTEMKVDSITFLGQSLAPVPPRGTVVLSCKSPDPVLHANFFPSMQYSMVDVPAVQSLEGRQNDIYGPYSYDDRFVSGGFEDDVIKKTYIFLTAVPLTSVHQIDFPGQHSGGLALPRNSVQSVSRSRGATNVAVSTPKLTANQFFSDASQVASFLDAKLFGVIPLVSLLTGEAELELADMPGIVPQIADALSTVYQTAVGWVDKYQRSVQSVQDFLDTVRTQATQACRGELQSKILQLAAPFTPYLNEFDTVASDLGSKKTPLETALDAIQALPPAQRDAILAAAAPVQATVESLKAELMSTLIDQLTKAIDSLLLAAFQIEQTLDQMAGILLDAEAAAGNIVTQLQDIQAQLQQLANDPAIKCIATNNCGDLKVALTAFVQEQLQFQLNALVQQVADGIGQQLTAPAAALQQQANVYLESVSSGIDAAVATAITVIGQNQAEAIAQIQNAQDQYDAAVTSAQTAIDDAVTQVQDAVNTQIDTVLNAAITTLTAQILQDPSVTNAISEAADDFGQAITLVAQILDFYQYLKNLLQTPLQYGVQYTLSKLKLNSSGIFLGQPDPPTMLSIDAKISVSLALEIPPKPNVDYSVDATINDFAIALLTKDGDGNFLTVFFDHVTFTTRNHEQAKVDCKLKTVTFGAAMAFVQGLASAFGPLQSGKSGPSILPTADGLTIGYGFSFPDTECGGFQITGLYLGAQLVLPFNDSPLLMRFYFARPEKHFLMSAGIYGGGGYLVLEAGPGAGGFATIQSFQLVMEFGATVALDLEVASGEAHVLGGFYIALSAQECVLTGFVRAGGSMDILGLITMSIEWYLGLTYENDHDSGGGHVSGEASVTVSISIGFFSVSATMSMHWGWNGDNKQADNARVQPLEPRPQVAHLAAVREDRSAPQLRSAVYVPPAQVFPRAGMAGGTPPPLKRMTHLDIKSWNQYAAAFAPAPHQ